MGYRARMGAVSGMKLVILNGPPGVGKSTIVELRNGFGRIGKKLKRDCFAEVVL